MKIKCSECGRELVVYCLDLQTGKVVCPDCMEKAIKEVSER